MKILSEVTHEDGSKTYAISVSKCSNGRKWGKFYDYRAVTIDAAKVPDFEARKMNNYKHGKGLILLQDIQEVDERSTKKTKKAIEEVMQTVQWEEVKKTAETKPHHTRKI